MKKKLLNLFMILGVILTFTSTIHAEDDFEIETYDIDVVVKEDGRYFVTETLHVRFLSAYKRGIYMDIPQRYEDVQWEFGDQIIRQSYYFPVTGVEVLSNHKKEIDKEVSSVRIRLGDENRYANEYETYKVSYVIHSKDLGLDGVQLFYQNLISSGWDAEIKDITFRVEMPKDFDHNKVYIYTDGNETDESLTMQVDGKYISGEFSGTYGSRRALTMYIELPEGYFQFKGVEDSIPFLLGFAAIIVAIVVFLFQRQGQGEKVVKTVEFSAPKGISSAEVGYIVDGVVDDHDIVSLIFEWANGGYLTIEDQESNLLLVKLNDLPADRPFFEKEFFNGIFSKRDSVTTKQLQKELYKPLSESKSSLLSYYKLPKNRIFRKDSKRIQWLLIILSALPLSILSGLAVYYWTYNRVLGFIPVMMSLVLLILIEKGCVGLVEKKLSTKQKVRHVISVIVVFGIHLAQMLFLLYLSKFSDYVTLIGLYGLFLVSLGFVAFSGKRTKHGVQVYGQILGLYDFIQYAEKDRLNMLFKEDPQIFYRVLPYAYAFGLTKVWSEHFADFQMEPPTWYVGAGPFRYYYFMSAMNSGMRQVSRPLPPPSSSGSRGGGFGGGGGGFSGGGFGGSSGGSW